MPTFDLSETTPSIGCFDVIGQYANVSTTFMRHVGLHSGNNDSIAFGGDVDVVHMRPPLERPGKMAAHVVGTLPLTNDEIKEMDAWLEEETDERKRDTVDTLDQFCIYPSWAEIYDPGTRVLRYRRYSCAGFVIYAYLKVGISLLNINEATLPSVSEDQLLEAYPELRRPHIREKIRPEGVGPWPIVLPGYVLHALNRPQEEIRRRPYQAQAGDEHF